MPSLLSNKTILITGSTDGLGKLVAKDLAMQGAIVLLHGRDKEKGKAVLNELSGLTKNNQLKYYNGDFSSLQDVKALSEEIRQTQQQIDIIINNVGVGSGKAPKDKREVSKDGLELRFAVNYLAHVLFTEKLLPVLKRGTSQIINVASVGQEPINFEDVMIEKRYDGLFAYRQAKTALIMYTFDLAERLRNEGIKVNAIHPASLMNTKMVMEGWGYSLTTVEQGAEAVESLLFADATGKYYDGKKESTAIPQAYDLMARNALKNITHKLLKDFLSFNSL
jgi:NAD(P)-dependent dehydrogenase (short-subunit alcohol dehydrogenase family)